MKKKIKHNNLLPWFTDDHGTLPASYLASCEKFFKSFKHQATSAKLQAPRPALMMPQLKSKIKLERNKL